MKIGKCPLCNKTKFLTKELHDFSEISMRAKIRIVCRKCWIRFPPREKIKI